MIKERMFSVKRLGQVGGVSQQAEPHTGLKNRGERKGRAGERDERRGGGGIKVKSGLNVPAAVGREQDGSVPVTPTRSLTGPLLPVYWLLNTRLVAKKTPLLQQQMAEKIITHFLVSPSRL